MGKNIGKPWEHHEKHIGNHWKTIRQPWEKLKKQLEKPFDNHGKT
jgi:hypothetical protein